MGECFLATRLWSGIVQLQALWRGFSHRSDEARRHALHSAFLQPPVSSGATKDESSKTEVVAVGAPEEEVDAVGYLPFHVADMLTLPGPMDVEYYKVTAQQLVALNSSDALKACARH